MYINLLEFPHLMLFVYSFLFFNMLVVCGNCLLRIENRLLRNYQNINFTERAFFALSYGTLFIFVFVKLLVTTELIRCHYIIKILCLISLIYSIFFALKNSKTIKQKIVLHWNLSHFVILLLVLFFVFVDIALEKGKSYPGLLDSTLGIGDLPEYYSIADNISSGKNKVVDYLVGDFGSISLGNVDQFIDITDNLPGRSSVVVNLLTAFFHIVPLKYKFISLNVISIGYGLISLILLTYFVSYICKLRINDFLPLLSLFILAIPIFFSLIAFGSISCIFTYFILLSVFLFYLRNEKRIYLPLLIISLCFIGLIRNEGKLIILSVILVYFFAPVYNYIKQKKYLVISSLIFIILLPILGVILVFSTNFLRANLWVSSLSIRNNKLSYPFAAFEQNKSIYDNSYYSFADFSSVIANLHQVYKIWLDYIVYHYSCIDTLYGNKLLFLFIGIMCFMGWTFKYNKKFFTENLKLLILCACFFLILTMHPIALPRYYFFTIFFFSIIACLSFKSFFSKPLFFHYLGNNTSHKIALNIFLVISLFVIIKVNYNKSFEKATSERNTSYTKIIKWVKIFTSQNSVIANEYPQLITCMTGRKAIGSSWMHEFYQGMAKKFYPDYVICTSYLHFDCYTPMLNNIKEMENLNYRLVLNDKSNKVLIFKSNYALSAINNITTSNIDTLCVSKDCDLSLLMDSKIITNLTMINKHGYYLINKRKDNIKDIYDNEELKRVMSSDDQKTKEFILNYLET